MTVWNLSRLRYTIRKITGRFDTTQLPDSSSGNVSVNNPPGIDDYINDFLYDLPEHLRSLKLKQFYTFTTIPNVGTYNLPPNYYNVEPPIYIDNYQFAWYQSPDIFYRIWPELNFVDRQIATANGTAGPYTFTLTQTPIQQGNVVIGISPNLDGNPSPQFETFTDVDTPALLDQPTLLKFTNPGTLTGNLGGTGTVDYLTGVVTITYANPVASGSIISAHYHPYVASRPRDIMFYQQQLFLRPIPNDVYAVKLQAYIQPTVAISSLTQNTTPGINSTTKTEFDGTLTDVLLFNEWWQMVAYGSSIKIFIEDGDHDEVERNIPYFEQAKLLAQRRCLKQLSNQRIQTPYAENVSGPAWPIFPIY
jgi:hypothetical protein